MQIYFILLAMNASGVGNPLLPEKLEEHMKLICVLFMVCAALVKDFQVQRKFCTMMNLPTLLTKKNYSKISQSLTTAVHDAAQEVMLNAGGEVSSLLGSECGFSVDGSWQKRGDVSLNGCVVASSIDIGKILNVEPMSRYCKGCQTNEKLDKESDKYRMWEANPVNCEANF